VAKGEFKESKLDDLELGEYDIFILEAALKRVHNIAYMDVWIENLGSQVFERCDKTKLDELYDKIEAIAIKLRYDKHTNGIATNSRATSSVVDDAEYAG
jgi:trimethylamine:corrinoid methyltransferase-like protein